MAFEYDTTWTNWCKKFAYMPKKIALYEEVNNGISYRNHTGYKWIWLSFYWQRQRTAIYTVAGRIVTEYDYAFDLFDIMKKQ